MFFLSLDRRSNFTECNVRLMDIQYEEYRDARIYILAFDHNLLWNKWMRIYLRRRVRNFGNKHSSMNFQFSSKALCLPERKNHSFFTFAVFKKRVLLPKPCCIRMTRSRREAKEQAHFFLHSAMRNVCVSTAAEDQPSELKSKLSLYMSISVSMHIVQCTHMWFREQLLTFHFLVLCETEYRTVNGCIVGNRNAAHCNLEIFDDKFLTNK